jgi:hypothetical protein
MKQEHQKRANSTSRVRQEVIRDSSIYCCGVNRTYLRVVLLEAAIIVALVIFGRLFS